MTPPALPATAIRRIAGAVIAGELRRLREEDIGQGRADAADLYQTLDLDSLETLGVAAALAETFDLDHIGFAPDSPTSVDGWANRLPAGDIERITVATSGSTGEATRHAHAVADLIAEAEHFAARLGERRRVIALVPADHLYGLVWTALLPAVLDAPVTGASLTTMPAPEPGDLIVAVPDHWTALARFRRRWPAEVAGVSSGAPLAAPTGDRLMDTGLARLLDIYGSSETGAIAVRELPETSHELLARWQLAEHEDGHRLYDRAGRCQALPDRIRRVAPRRIVVEGRHDQAVQVGGHNVYPERIANRLAEHPAVAAAAVRRTDNERLKAFIVPAEAGADDAQLEADLRRYLVEHFIPAERPTRFRFGAALPRSAMGKPADWS